MTGFTGVVWDARTTEQLALDLGDGAGPAPLVEAGLAWADVAAELGSAGAEYGSILAALGVHWRSSYTSEAFEKLTRLVPWFAEAAAAAGRTAARAETQAAAVTVARMTMPNLAEVDLAEKAKDVATTVSALAPALVGAAAQAERALHDQRMRAARVMETYEAATEPAAQPWPGGPAAPNLVSATALGAERAARETAARAAARQATVTPPVAPGASMMGGVGPALAVPAPEKTRYAPTILAGAGPAATTAPVTAPSTGTGTPTGPVAPPMAPHGAATTERVIARGAGAAEPATDVEPSGAAAAADGTATWAELAVAEQPVAHHLSTGHGDRPLDPRYLDETLALDGRTGA
ncbi:PPE domain-containing protein [Gordonia insulae]|uniref:PPE domain-containing protein n=1 Tax=Gordonia insulae TaxID=2420509 RepID=A0A3G8JV45_9ACTN|nr:PPE domain-containing protein [Gordonia insulae]AZG48439.1 hypothetical protein D7316_05056 [Gordonia insulae]